ncbi:MAG: ATP-binding protein [Clostridiales bacterium]|jgi:anti-sigma regulatory factor (Ser/Thr protein kinase)|nr:ATP-binding protein [Clostridiales bacterium]
METWSFRDTFSTLDQMRLVLRRALDDARNHLPVEEETWYDIKVILHELCCNALEHGKHPVELYSAMCDIDHMLHILVADSGGGFIPGITLADTFAERGRGLAIVDHLATDLMFNETANKVLVRIAI